MRTCYENGWEFYSVCVNVSQVITKPMCSILLTFPRILPVSVVFNSFPKAQKFFSLYVLLLLCNTNLDFSV